MAILQAHRSIKHHRFYPAVFFILLCAFRISTEEKGKHAAYSKLTLLQEFT